MKTRTVKLILPALLALAMVLFYACSKERSVNNSDALAKGKTKLTVFLTDGPYDFQQVLIDIKRVEVLVDTCREMSDADDDEHHDGDHHEHEGEHHDDDHDISKDTCEVWSELAIHPGIYNVLELRNGNDTLLGASFIPNGKIKKVKITLGDQNSIMADSIVHPLKIRNGESFVVIKVRREHLDSIAPGNFHLLMDFNLARAIRFDGGVYWLKPQLKLYSRHHTGEIEGRVSPRGSYGLIRAANATDTAYALPDCDDEGEFKIRGLKTGTYDVFIDGINGYSDTTISPVHVEAGKETELGKITLHQ